MKLFNGMFLLTVASVVAEMVYSRLPTGVPVGLWVLTALAFGRLLMQGVSNIDAEGRKENN